MLQRFFSLVPGNFSVTSGVITLYTLYMYKYELNGNVESVAGPLRDNKNEIRFAAARALSACLAVLKERKYHLQSYCNIYDQICHGLKKKSKEEV